jgi:inosine/xanthosine triphosphate pyrophosphatase family protein
MTMAEATTQEKQRVSHRGRAFAALLAAMRDEKDARARTR